MGEPLLFNEVMDPSIAFFFFGSDQDDLTQPAHFTVLEITSATNHNAEVGSTVASHGIVEICWENAGNGGFLRTPPRI